MIFSFLREINLNLVNNNSSSYVLNVKSILIQVDRNCWVILLLSYNDTLDKLCSIVNFKFYFIHIIS